MQQPASFSLKVQSRMGNSIGNPSIKDGKVSKPLVKEMSESKKQAIQSMLCRLETSTNWNKKPEPSKTPKPAPVKIEAPAKKLNMMDLHDYKHADLCCIINSTTNNINTLVPFLSRDIKKSNLLQRRCQQ